jgi:hypothetical protein
MPPGTCQFCHSPTPPAAPDPTAGNPGDMGPVSATPPDDAWDPNGPKAPGWTFKLPEETTKMFVHCDKP